VFCRVGAVGSKQRIIQTERRLNQMLRTSVPDADTAPFRCSLVTGFFGVLVQLWE
jgi:hypothetical protein